MSSNHQFNHLVHHALEGSKKMPPVPRGKNPFIGFIAGFVGGPIGTGIYLKSGKDCAILFGLLIAGTVFTGGVAAPLFWCVCAIWTAIRVHNSNAFYARLASTHSQIPNH